MPDLDPIHLSFRQRAEMRAKIKRQGLPLFQAVLPAAGAAAAAATATQPGSSSDDDAIRRSFLSGTMKQ